MFLCLSLYFCVYMYVLSAASNQYTVLRDGFLYLHFPLKVIPFLGIIFTLGLTDNFCVDHSYFRSHMWELLHEEVLVTSKYHSVIAGHPVVEISSHCAVSSGSRYKLGGCTEITVTYVIQPCMI